MKKLLNSVNEAETKAETLIKKEKWELVLQKASELGCKKIEEDYKKQVMHIQLILGL